MDRSIWWWRGLVALVLVLCIAFTLSASAQQGNKTGPLFASIDMVKVNADYKDMQLERTNFEVAAKKLQDQLDRRNTMPLLPEEDHKLLDTLHEKGAAQTDADKNKIKEMNDKSTKLRGEYETLQTKPDSQLTDADKAKLRQIEADLLKAKQNFAVLKDESENKLREMDKSTSEKLSAKFRTAVQKVAEQKGVAIVFKSDVVAYAGTDLTQAVLSELNKK